MSHVRIGSEEHDLLVDSLINFLISFSHSVRLDRYLQISYNKINTLLSNSDPSHTISIVVFAVMDSTLGERSCPHNYSSYPYFPNDAVGRLLLDGDYTSCLQPFSEGNRFQRLISYVYMPPHTPSLGLIINIFVIDLNCDDPTLLIYIGGDTVEGKKRMQQCSLQENVDSMRDITTLCSFKCFSKYPLERELVVFVQIEMMPWETHIQDSSICEVNSEIYTPNI